MGGRRHQPSHILDHHILRAQRLDRARELRPQPRPGTVAEAGAAAGSRDVLAVVDRVAPRRVGLVLVDGHVEHLAGLALAHRAQRHPREPALDERRLVDGRDDHLVLRPDVDCAALDHRGWPGVRIVDGRGDAVDVTGEPGHAVGQFGADRGRFPRSRGLPVAVGVEPAEQHRGALRLRGRERPARQSLAGGAAAEVAQGFDEVLRRDVELDHRPFLRGGGVQAGAGDRGGQLGGFARGGADDRLVDATGDARPPLSLRRFRRALVVNDPAVAEPPAYDVGQRLPEDAVGARIVDRHGEHVALDQLARLNPLRRTPLPRVRLAAHVERMLGCGPELRCAHRLKYQHVVGLPAHHRRHRPAPALVGEHHVPDAQGFDGAQAVFAGVDQRPRGEARETPAQHVHRLLPGDLIPVDLRYVAQVRRVGEPVRQHLRRGLVELAHPRRVPPKHRLDGHVQPAGPTEKGADPYLTHPFSPCPAASLAACASSGPTCRSASRRTPSPSGPAPCRCTAAPGSSTSSRAASPPSRPTR